MDRAGARRVVRAGKGAHFMTDDKAMTAARLRVREAEEKLDRQTRRYALMTVESDPGAKVAKTEKAEAAKALLAALEAELEAAREALRKLEA
jgi:hypothetical protein